MFMFSLSVQHVNVFARDLKVTVQGILPLLLLLLLPLLPLSPLSLLHLSISLSLPISPYLSISLSISLSQIHLEIMNSALKC